MSFSRCLFLCMGLGFGSAHAVTNIIVDSDSGAYNITGACVLRDAITFANSGTPTGGCSAQGTTTSAPTIGVNSYTIELPQAATITLTEVDNVTNNAGLPAITAVVTIDGNGSVIQRDPQLGCNGNGVTDPGEFRLLYNANVLILNEVTLRGGCADSANDLLADGGAINSVGSLTLNNVVLSDNYASNRGGALYALGFSSSDAINDSTFRDNTAPAGAGLFFQGTTSSLHVERSLFLHNSSAYGAGASIAENATAVFINSTFSNNTAGKASAIAADGLVTLVSSTVAGNDGTALHISTAGGPGQKATIKNSLFSANTGSFGNCYFGVQSNVALLGVNLSSDDSCAGFAMMNTDAKLSPLADNGGLTLTYALEANSPAIDAVLDCTDADGVVLDRDQRWHLRPQDSTGQVPVRCDIGAFERDDKLFGDNFEPIIQ